MLLFYWETVLPREDGTLGGSRSSWRVRQLGLNRSLSHCVRAPHFCLASLDKYARRLDIVNRGRLYFSPKLANCISSKGAGLSGYNTEWGTIVFEQTLPKAAAAHLYPKMQLLIIWFGGCSYLLGSQQSQLAV